MPSAPPTAERAARPSSAAVSGPSRTAAFSFWRLALQWAPPVLWMAMILLASSDSLGAPRTEGWLRTILAVVFGALPERTLDLIHILLRKAGHLAAYAVQGWLSYRSARGPRPAALAWSRRAAVFALGFSFATALFDELHQLLTETRSGSAWDVALDMAGVLLALALIWLAAKRTSNRLRLRRPVT